jgi:hypothetical protein
VLQDRAHCIRLATFKGGKEFFCLAAELIEVGTGWKIFFHNKIRDCAWIRKQASRILYDKRC